MDDPTKINNPKVSASLEKAAIPVYEKKRFNIWKPLAFLLFILVVILGTYIYTLSLNKKDNPIPVVTPHVLPTMPPDASTSASPPVPAMKLSQVLLQSCIENKITLDKLPFILAPSFKETYKIENSINCYPPKESYANMGILPDGGMEGRSRMIYFFHEASIWEGTDSPFVSLNTYKSISVGGQNYWLEVMSPPPNGISTLGLWVRVITEKKDEKTGTIARVLGFDIIKDQRVLDLIKKNGQGQGDPKNPIYTITNPGKVATFTESFRVLAPELDQIKAMAGQVSTDLSGVSF